MEMSKRILFISYDGMTDPLGQSQVIPYLKGLTKFGYSFTILSCDKPARYAINRAYVEQLITGFPIIWISLPYHKNPSVISAIYDYCALKRKAVALHLAHPFDMVHSRPGTPSLVALHLKKKFGIKFLNDIRGFWADERVDGNIWNLNNPIFKKIYQFFKQHEHNCLLEADYNISLTYKGRDVLHSQKNIPNQPIPIEVIPCSVDLDLFNPEKIDPSLKEKFRNELNINEGDFVMSYLGSIGGWYLTHEMLRFCKAVAEKIPRVKFLFISPDSHEQIIMAATKCGLSENQIVVKQGERHEVPALLSLSIYSLFFIKPCHSKIASSPTKHGEIMAMGIPVITNDGVGDVADIVTKCNGGYVLNNFSKNAFNEVIEMILAGNTFDTTAIRTGASHFYALENAVDRYRKVYDRIFSGDVKR